MSLHRLCAVVVSPVVMMFVLATFQGFALSTGWLLSDKVTNVTTNEASWPEAMHENWNWKWERNGSRQ